MKTYRTFLIAALVLLLFAVLLGFAAKGAGPLAGDLAISRAVQSLLPYNDGVRALWKVMDDMLRYLPYIVFAVVLLLRKWDWALLLVLVCLPVALYGEAQLKPPYARPRPTADLVTIYQASKGLSFPSGTALNAMASAGVAVYFAWLAGKSNTVKIWARVAAVLSLLFLLLSNLARIHVGAHWATDILGGWLFGGVWLMMMIAGHQWWLSRRLAEKA